MAHNMRRYTLILLIGVLLALFVALVGGAAGNEVQSPLGTLIRLNSVTTNDQVVHGVDMDATGGFVAVWDGQPVDDCCLENDPPDVMARQFDANGQPKGVEFIVNANENGDQIMPAVGVAPDGNFLITYYDRQIGRYCSQYYSAAGVPSHPDSCLIVNNQVATSDYYYDMNMSPDGEHAAVAFAHYQEVYVQSLTGQGHPVNGPEVLVAGDGDLWEYPAVAVGNDGSIVVVWMVPDMAACENDFTVMARRYDANKAPKGNAFKVTCGANNVDVVMNAGGKFAVVWDAPDGDGYGIFARRFKADGTTDGAVFRVNQAIAKHQSNPSAAMNAIGDLYVTWKQEEPQIWGIPIDWPIMGRVFPAAGLAGDEFRTHLQRGNNPMNNHAAIGDDGQVLTVWSTWGQDGSNEGSYGQFGRPELPDISFLLSTLADGRIGTLRYQRSDIIEYDQASGKWSMYFDASAYGLNKDIADFALLPDGDLLLIIKVAVRVPGAGQVQPQDVVRFDADTQKFSLYMDGSDVGLTTLAERLDALAVDADGSLLLSIVGGGTMGSISVRDQDLVRFTPSQTGSNTAGVWTELLPGLYYNMPKDLMTVWADTAGADLYFYMTFNRAVQVSNDYKIPRGTIMRCRPYYPQNGIYSDCLIDLYWNAHQAGMPATARIDGLELLVGE